MHALTRYSQDTPTIVVPTRLPSLNTSMLFIPIPLKGQLNITASTTPIPVKDVKPLLLVAVVKLNVILAEDVDVLSVSSCPAHMSPSSPGSVGIPSNKTLLRGALHTLPESARLEQPPVIDDPFSEIISAFSSYAPG